MLRRQKASSELNIRLENKEGEQDLHRLARQGDQSGKDVRQVRVIKDRYGNLLLSEESVLKRWDEYFEGPNEENERKEDGWLHSEKEHYRWHVCFQSVDAQVSRKSEEFSLFLWI